MAIVKLGDIAIEAKSSNKGDKTGIRIVGLEHLTPLNVTLLSWSEDTENTFTKEFSKGDVLFGRRRAYLKKAAVAPFDGICSGDITVIRAIEDKVDPDLLPFIIQNDFLFDFAVGKSAGSLSPRVKWTHLKEFAIELPSMPEQSKLAETLWSINETKNVYEELINKTDELVKSQFIEMFDRPEYERVKFKKISTLFADGDWIEIKDQSNDGIRLVQTGNIGNGYYIDKEAHSRYVSEETFLRLNCTEILPGDILISRLPDPVGRGCILPDGIGKAITAVDCTIVRLMDMVEPEYLIGFTQTDLYRSQIESAKTGTTRKRISRKNLEKVLIPVPPIEKQMVFVELIKESDKSKFALQEAIKDLDTLSKKIIAENLIPVGKE
ncbi:restriction endonuclease subunit S [uncultured Veillonella sp.]|uniref:restriction endonuclease subunit S n=1 Tax=uncultured Veillonella sp. TaxID=159268 RepID=UPI002599EDA5|nr:restriction endonuclease subunit S [uncultured Veillonella sp.]